MINNNNIKIALFAEQIQHLSTDDRFFFQKDEPQYRFNIIGVGMIGMEHIRVTELEGRATVHGIFDVNQKSIAAAQAQFKKIHPQRQLVVYPSLHAACTDPKIDALIICTPNGTHLDILSSAIESKKPILVEKPMATTIADAYQIHRIAQRYSSIIQVGLQYRFKAIYQEAIAAGMERAAIGAIKTITIIEHRLPFLDKVQQWNKFARSSGGTLVEKCCHYFDLFNLFAQSRPHAVTAVGDRAVNYHDFKYHGKSSDIIDNALVNIVYENGIKAHFNLCMFAPMFHEEIMLCGDEGRIHAFETEDFLPGKKIKTGFTMHSANKTAARRTEPEYLKIIQESGHSGSTFFEHVQFIDAIAGNPSNAATVAEGFWSIVIGAAAEQSIRTNKMVLIRDIVNAHTPPDAQLPQ